MTTAKTTLVQRDEHNEILELAAWFQDELARHGNLIRSYRWLRNGTLTPKEFLEKDECGESIHLGKTVPVGIFRLNDWREQQRIEKEREADPNARRHQQPTRHETTLAYLNVAFDNISASLTTLPSQSASYDDIALIKQKLQDIRIAIDTVVHNERAERTEKNRRAAAARDAREDSKP